MLDEAVQQQEAREWLSLAAASEKLGVSVQTLRRKIKANQIPARQVQSPYGLAWEVSLYTVERAVNTEETDEGGSSTSESGLSSFDEGESPTAEQAPSSTPGMVEALRLIAKLQGEVVARSEACAMWQTRAEMLSVQLSTTQGQLSAVQEQVKALQAPKVEMSQGPKPWWRFW